MKIILRVLIATVALFFTIVFTSLTFVFIKHFWIQSERLHRADRVSILEISGAMWSSTAFLRDLEELLDDKSVKAIVVRVASPGGFVAPSQEIYQGILKADKKVPVFISMGATAASGGYYAALGGRRIFASPGTLTASIGVIVELANTRKLYQWAKIERYAIKSGRFKDTGSPFRDMLPEERELLLNMVMDIYGQFRKTVKERRKLTDEELTSVADGRVLTGNQAKMAKLIDELGGLEDAIRAAKLAAKLPESAEVEYPESRSGLLRRLLLGGDDQRGGDEASQWLQIFRGPTETLLNPLKGIRVMLLAPVQ